MKQVLILSSLILSFFFSFSQNIISVTKDSLGTKIVTIKRELVLFDSVTNTKFTFRPVFEYVEANEFYERKAYSKFIGFEIEEYNKYAINHIHSFHVSYETNTSLKSYDFFVNSYKKDYEDRKSFYSHENNIMRTKLVLNTPIKMIKFNKISGKECIIKLKDDSEKRYFVELYKELENNGFYYTKPMDVVKKDDDGCITYILKKTDDGTFIYVPTNIHNYHKNHRR